MQLASRRRVAFASLPRLAVVALSVLPAATAVAAEYWSVRAAAHQTAMVPLGERAWAPGTQLRLSLSEGTLVAAKLHSACGPALSYPAHGLLPAFSLRPTFGDENAPNTAVVSAPASLTNPRLLAVQRPARSLLIDEILGQRADALAPVLQLGAEPQQDPAPTQASEPGCFSWFEVELDATGVPAFTKIALVIEEFRLGTALSSEPDGRFGVLAAQVTP